MTNHSSNQHIVIIGNGISGVTTARHVRKSCDVPITIISAESKYFFSRTALMYVFMGHMKFEHTQPYEDDFWEKNNINLIHGSVQKVDFDQQILHLDEGQKLLYEKLVIATGSKTNMFDWPGQNGIGVTGLYSKQDLENLEELAISAKKAVLVGGGLIGVELAEMLRTRGVEVKFLIRENRFWGGVLPKEDAEMLQRHMREHGVELELESELDEIILDANNKVKAIRTKKGYEFDCDIVGIATGVSPNISLFENSILETDKGVLVNRCLETNINNVYALGDCAQQRESLGERKAVEAVWYTGRIMGETLAQTLVGNQTEYNPGPWFNSAKFFDIEYQTYGWVWAEPKENESQIFWENEKNRVAMRVAFETSSHRFLGINTYGVRLKHEYFDTVLRNNTSLEHVLQNLDKAFFDPEFYRSYSGEIRAAFSNKKQIA